MGAPVLPPTLKGSVQQRLNGSSILFGSTPVYQGKRLVVLLLGDSNTAAYNIREALWVRLRSFRGGIKFQGTEGLQANTGGSIGRRRIGDWRHEGHSGRRVSRSFTGTVNPATGVFTVVGHDLATNVAVVFSSTGTLPGGLLPNKVYYATNVSGNTFQVMTTESGTAITSYTDAGTGTLTAGTGLLELWPGVSAAYDEAPDVVFVKAGTNDIVGGVDATTVTNSMSALVDAVMATYPAAEIVICSIAPVVPGSTSGASWATYAAVRNTYVANLPGVAVSKGNKVGFFDTASGLGVGNIGSDGIHPLFSGYWTEGTNYATALQRLYRASYGSVAPRTITTRAATASVALVNDTDVVTLPYDPALSPGRDASGNQVDQSFAVGLWHYPTALPADSLVRILAKYSFNHPAGFLIGHFATSGNGGGISVYLGSSGSPVISGSTAAAYSGEALKLNQWHRIWVFFDRAKLQCGLFINAKLVLWAPIPSAWTIAEQHTTYIGRLSPFNAGHGYTDSYVLAKGSHLNVDNALEYVEADYYDFVLPPGVTAHYGLSDGSGTSTVPISNTLPNGTLSGATWSAAGAIPKTGIDEVLP